jgi:RNA-directed DNA polymerase
VRAQNKIRKQRMEIQSPMFEDSLFERVVSIELLEESFVSVKRNRGAAGVDNVSVLEFSNNLSKELSKLSQELRTWTYKPQPVRRVEIPKPDGGVRLLGVPCVRDRVVQNAIRLAIEPILDKDFSKSSYAFRPGHNQQQAVEAAQAIITSGKEWIVDIDLSKFFDRIHHDRLIHRLGQRIDDRRILKLVGMILRSGIMENGLVSASTEGAPQGGPLSPLLSNLVLDELDKELERRELEFCRFADDCNIFVGSQKAAERVMASVTKFIEKNLRLVVNQEKSRVARCEEVKFLGMTVINGTRAISKKSMAKAMCKVKDLTPRGTHEPIERCMEKINQWYVGWSNYYSMTEYPSQLATVEAHIRRRLRTRFVRQKKRQRFLVKDLVSRGVSGSSARRTVYTNNGPWALSHKRAVEKAYSNDWFKRQLNFKTMSERADFTHWKDPKIWIRLP